jgi:predicted TIM-barrel enzyme
VTGVQTCALPILLGYGTGCCACFDETEIKNIIGCENSIKLLMGIGFKNNNVNRRVHHTTGFVFPTKKKQLITVNHIN